MTWSVAQLDRPDPAVSNHERAALEDWLRFHRQTLLMKCAGLTAEQLKIASVEPSGLTLLGLVRHLTKVERVWFRARFSGEDVALLYCTDEVPDGDFDLVADADADADVTAFRDECAAADSAVAARSMTRACRAGPGSRWICGGSICT
jgi:hypothetical protein